MYKHISCALLSLSCLISISSIKGVFIREQKTPLILALEKNEFEKAEQFLDDGSNPNAIFERSPLIVYFAQKGNAAAISILLSHGANIDAVAPCGHSAINHAAGYGHIEALQELLQANPSYKTDYRQGNGPHHAAANKSFTSQPSIIKILNDYFAPKGIDIDVRCSSQMTPLMYAASLGRLRVVETCLDLGASQLCQDGGGRTALMHCLTGMEEQRMHRKITSGQELEYYKQFQGILTLLNRNPDTRSTLCNGVGQSARDIAIKTKQARNWDAALSAAGISPFSRDRVAPAYNTVVHMPTIAPYIPAAFR